MRVALLTLLMLLPTVLSATSYAFGVFKGTVRTVPDGRFVYVELDPDYRPGPNGPGHWLRIEGGVEEGTGWAASGMYPAGDPEHPLWIGSLDCLFGGQVFAGRDGRVAAVVRDGRQPELKFYRDGLLRRSWRFPDARPLYKGTAYSRFMEQCFNCKVVTDQLWLTDYGRIDWYFSMSTGEYLGQSRAPRPVPRPREFAGEDEIADFEKALGGGEPVAPDEGRRTDAGNLAPPESPERRDEDSGSRSSSAAVKASPLDWCISGCEPPFDADSVLPALSPRPRLSHDVFSVGDGRFVYVQIDRTVQIGSRFNPQEFPWQKSGLYRVEDPANPLWEAFLDLWMYDTLYVSDEGRMAAVLHLGQPSVDFYFDGETVSRYPLPHPPYGRHASKTGFGGGLFSWWKQEVVDQFLVVKNRVGDEWWFLLRTGQLVRRGYGGHAPVSDEELADFENALGDGDEPAPDEGSTPDEESGAWVGEVPAGASVFVSADGAVRVVQIPAGCASGPGTAAYDAQGRRLWTVKEVLPRPVFLGDYVSGTVLGEVYATERGDFPLAISADGQNWAVLQYDPAGRAASARLFSGKETRLTFPSTYEGELKFGGVCLQTLDGQRLTVVLDYGTDWSEEYRVRLADGAMEHLTNFPAESEQDDSAAHRSSGSSYFWLSIILPAAFILLIGFLAGRISRRT